MPSLMNTFQLDPEAVHWREIQGDVLALDFRQSRYLTVNPTGQALWPLLDRGATLEELSQELVDRFGVDEQVARADVAQFLDWLRQANLLRAQDG